MTNTNKYMNIIKKISLHKISLSRAAEECEISLWEMLDKIKEKNVDWTGYTKKDLEKDLKILKLNS